MASTSDVGSFRVPLLPSGEYELIVEKAGFAKYQQGPIALRLNQQAEFDVTLAVSGTVETIAITESAPMINTTNAEISTHFDPKRVSELPLAPNRNLLNLAASIPWSCPDLSRQLGIRPQRESGDGTRRRAGFLGERHARAVQRVHH